MHWKSRNTKIEREVFSETPCSSTVLLVEKDHEVSVVSEESWHSIFSTCSSDRFICRAFLLLHEFLFPEYVTQPEVVGSACYLYNWSWCMCSLGFSFLCLNITTRPPISFWAHMSVSQSYKKGDAVSEAL